MAKKDEWTTCGECAAEFRVIAENNESIGFCPFCGYELEEDLPEDEEWDD